MPSESFLVGARLKIRIRGGANPLSPAALTRQGSSFSCRDQHSRSKKKLKEDTKVVRNVAHFCVAHHEAERCEIATGGFTLRAHESPAY